MTLKLERGRSRLVKAKRQALTLMEDSLSDNDETEQSSISEKKKARRRKVSHSTLPSAVASDEEDSNAV